LVNWSQQIPSLVQCVRFDDREDVMGYELLLQVFHVHLGSARLQCFVADPVEVILLADVGDVGDNVISFVGQPLQNHRSVQSAAVRENYLLLDHFIPPDLLVE